MCSIGVAVGVYSLSSVLGYVYYLFICFFQVSCRPSVCMQKKPISSGTRLILHCRVTQQETSMGYVGILPITSIRLFLVQELHSQRVSTGFPPKSPFTLRGNTEFIAFYFKDVSPTRVIRHVPNLSFPGNPRKYRIEIRECLRKVVNLCVFFSFYCPTEESLGLFISIISFTMVLCSFSKRLIVRAQ